MPISLRQLAETAAFASARAAFILEDRNPVSPDHLQNYWKCCRGRMLDWLRLLQSTAAEAESSEPAEHAALWDSVRPAVEAILVSDILIRVWGTILTAADMNRGVQEATPIARHTFNGHLDVRNQALRLVLDGLQIPVSEVARVDRLRRKAERWTDILIGHLALNYQLDEFAHEPERAVEFGTGQIREILNAADEPMWDFVQTGIRLAFPQKDVSAAGEPWNQGIVRAVLGSFPSHSFDEFGMFKSVRRMRIEREPGAGDRVLNALSSVMGAEPASRKRRQVSFAKARQQFGQR